jgi:predicted AAA+ superfamily ATPase
MNSASIHRLLRPPSRSFFLFGARGTGKSTWLKQCFPDALRLDLLHSPTLLRLLNTPSDLEALAGHLPAGGWVVLDEVQKVPSLLDEVHRLMEDRGWRFALCGSSARKLRREGVNLLAGRAITLSMEPFSAQELGKAFELRPCLDWGMLPFVCSDRANAAAILEAYVDTYLKEEIRAEGLVRSLAPFVRFLSVAGLLNGQTLNAQNVARDAAVPRATVDGYFSILTDTLLGHLLPAYRPRAKVREATHPKFYWLDPGVARAAAGLLHDPMDRAWRGFALETLVFHELRVYNQISKKGRSIAYHRTAAGAEIDFVVETRKRTTVNAPHVVCIEVKLANVWDRRWEHAMRSLGESREVAVTKMVGVYTGAHPLVYDGVEVLPVELFFERLHAGAIF